MSDSLSKFLINLASSPDLMKRFLDDPHTALDQARLTAKEKAAILARDAKRLREIFAAGPGGLGGIRVKKKVKSTGKAKTPGPKKK